MFSRFGRRYGAKFIRLFSIGLRTLPHLHTNFEVTLHVKLILNIEFHLSQYPQQLACNNILVNQKNSPTKSIGRFLSMHIFVVNLHLIIVQVIDQYSRLRTC